MAGLFGWFRNKNTNTNSQGSYFLEPDDAKTYGDIDYMRKSKTVRRTFPKTMGSSKGAEFIQEVSSMKAAKKTGFQSNNSSSISSNSDSSFGTSESSFQPTEPQRRRSTDTNMDMFRNMAKKIKKK